MAANPAPVLIPTATTNNAPKKTGPLAHLRLSWQSNGTHVPTGYGNQTALFVPRIAQQVGHLVVENVYGINGAPITNRFGVRELPPARDAFFNDMDAHYFQQERLHSRIMLLDAFVKHPANVDQWHGVFWAPHDCEGLSAEHRRSLTAGQRYWAMSKHAERAYIEVFGSDVVDYVPHGIDTKVYRPIDRVKARADLASKAWGVDLTGKYLIANVGANKGQPGRKNFAALIQVADRLHQRHNDVVLYIHTDPTGSAHGENLYEMIKQMGISVPVIFPDVPMLLSGQISSEYMNDVYNAADVYFHPSYGEGFGIPIVEAQAAGCPVVVTDGSAMTELAFSGAAVKSHRLQPFMGRAGCWWHLIDEDAALEALEAAYQSREDVEPRNTARIGALDYDVDTVFRKYMIPALVKIAEETGATEEFSQGVGLWRSGWFIQPSLDPKSDKALARQGLKRQVVNNWGMEAAGIKLDIVDHPTGHVAKMVCREIEDEYHLQDIEFADDDVFVDIGAQVGVVSCWAGKRWPNARVIAFEPVPENFKRLERNIKANGLTNVTAVNKAVTKDGRKVDIYGDLSENSGGSNVYGGSETPIAQAESITLAAIRAEYGMDKIKVLKMDCEGAEWEIAEDPAALHDIEYLIGEGHTNNLFLRQTGPAMATYRKLIPSVRFGIIPVPDVKIEYPKPDVSIIIPTYNGAATIQKAVDAALNLRGVTCEVVVVDDGSTDSTAELLATYAENSRVKVHSLPENRGQVAAMNTAIERCSADYVLFHGDDDWAGQGLVDLVRALDGNPDAAFAYGPQQFHGLRNDTYAPPPFDADQLWRRHYIANGVIFRRTLYTKDGLTYRKLHSLEGVGACEDYDFALQVIDKGYSGVMVNTAPVLHYTYAHGRQSTSKEQHMGEVLAAFRAEWPKFSGKVL